MISANDFYISLRNLKEWQFVGSVEMPAPDLWLVRLRALKSDLILGVCENELYDFYCVRRFNNQLEILIEKQATWYPLK